VYTIYTYTYIYSHITSKDKNYLTKNGMKLIKATYEWQRLKKSIIKGPGDYWEDKLKSKWRIWILNE
jgi:hypothetical protein